MKTIEEKNRMIAEFMGFKLQDNPNERWFGQYFTESNGTWGNRIEIMHFDTSWDWLMPVAEQIESIHEESNGVKYFLYDIDITQHSCRIDSIGIHMGGFNSKIEATYAAVLAFIEWYNENK